jgi:hypothetical protein
MSYQDKLISELEEENEILMKIDGLLKYKEENDAQIEEMKAIIAYDVKNKCIYNFEDIHPLIRYILEDFIKNPYTTSYNFFMECIKTETETEVYKVCNLLLSGVSYQEIIEVSPLFKDFLFSNPANQE